MTGTDSAQGQRTATFFLVWSTEGITGNPSDGFEYGFEYGFEIIGGSNNTPWSIMSARVLAPIQSEAEITADLDNSFLANDK